MINRLTDRAASRSSKWCVQRNLWWERLVEMCTTNKGTRVRVGATEWWSHSDVQRVVCPLRYEGMNCSLYANGLTVSHCGVCLCAANGRTTEPKQCRRHPPWLQKKLHSLAKMRPIVKRWTATLRESVKLSHYPRRRAIRGRLRQANISWMISCPLNASPTFSSQTPCVHVPS